MHFSIVWGRFRHEYIGPTSCEQAFIMEYTNSCNMTNESSSMAPQHVLNDSLALTTNNRTHGSESSTTAIIILSALGLPGNLLVIAVYVRKMTTSTRVYMFALAVADSSVCVCAFFVLFLGVTDLVTKLACSSVIDTSITFSMFLLVFISIERLVAVKHPHSFNMEPQRAKKYIIIIVVFAAIYRIVSGVSKCMRYGMFVRISESCVSVSCTFTMITCYTLMAAALLKKIRASRNQVEVLSVMRSLQPGTSHTVISTIDGAARANDPGHSNMLTNVKGIAQNSAPKSVSVTATNIIITKQAKAFKNMLMIFIITIVFIACWVPIWLMNMGVYLSAAVIRSMIINSVVNPFIYGVSSALFREDVRQLYRQARMKLPSCCH